ncbi:partner of bursicon-like [Lineus longissimus]|uniref:partner of bursicon-like n=1 Tax=Lineus longissimus TaxID=88925 RepID=UPI002B4C43DD
MKMAKLTQLILSMVTLLLATLIVTSQAAAGDDDLCETLETELYVTKEKTYDYNGRTRRLLCGGTIMVTKCEGLCKSHVQPSVVHYPGFKKSCQCCREGSLRSKLVTLHECFDGSKRISGQTANFLIKEPAECACYDCAI